MPDRIVTHAAVSPEVQAERRARMTAAAERMRAKSFATGFWLALEHTGEPLTVEEFLRRTE